MNRRYEIFKTSSGPSTGKALLNHTNFSPSQTGETVPLNSPSFIQPPYPKEIRVSAVTPIPCVGQDFFLCAPQPPPPPPVSLPRGLDFSSEKIRAILFPQCYPYRGLDFLLCPPPRGLDFSQQPPSPCADGHIAPL
jgi:hypothetical protein